MAKPDKEELAAEAWGGGVPLESRWDEAERGQAAGVRDAGTEAEPDAGRYLLKTGIAASSLPGGRLPNLLSRL